MKKNVLSCLLAVLLLFGAAAAPQQVFAAGPGAVLTLGGCERELVCGSVGLKNNEFYT